MNVNDYRMFLRNNKDKLAKDYVSEYNESFENYCFRRFLEWWKERNNTF